MDADSLLNSLIGCGVYYFLWINILPKLRGYRFRQEVIGLDGGAQTHRLVKVPVAELSEWDASHDAVGRAIGGNEQPHIVGTGIDTASAGKREQGEAQVVEGRDPEK